jgi:hypothetical protein
MGERAVTLRISATDNFSDVMRRYNTAIGQADTATTRAGNAARTQASAWTQMGGAMRGALIGIGVIGITRIASEMYDLGLSVDVAGQNFDALSQSVLGMASGGGVLQQLRDATGGIVTDFDLMAGANRLLAMGLTSSTDQLAQMTAGAVRLGAAFGKDAKGAIEEFSLMMANQSVLRLDTFGISGAAVRERMAELKEEIQGITREQAFFQATMEQMDVSLGRLGEAAYAGETGVRRLQASFENLKNFLAGEFARTINTAVDSFSTLAAAAEAGLLDDVITEFIGGEGASAASQQAINAQVDTYISGVAQRLIESGQRSAAEMGENPFMVDLIRASIRAAMDDPTLQADADRMIEMLATNMQLPQYVIEEYADVVNEAVGAYIGAFNEAERMARGTRQFGFMTTENLAEFETQATNFGVGVGVAYNRGVALGLEDSREISRLMSAGTTQSGRAGDVIAGNRVMAESVEFLQQMAYEYGLITDSAGMLGNITIVSPDDAARITTMSEQYDNLLARAQEAADEGLISADELDFLKAGADDAARMADEMERGAQALEDMSASELFGVGGGGVYGELSDEVIQAARDRGLTDAQVDELRDAFDLTSGRENEASIRWRDEIIPLIVETARTNSTEAATMALQQYIGEQAASQYGAGAADYLTGGQYIEVPGIGVNPQMMIPGLAGLGRRGGGEGRALPGRYMMDEGTDISGGGGTAFSQLTGEAVEFNKSLEDVSTTVSTIQGTIESLTLGANVVRLNFEVGTLPPLLQTILNLITTGGVATAVGQVTRDNGGVTPGTTAGSRRSTSGNTRNR